MAKYRYKATDIEGKKISGALEASSESDVYAKLRGQEMFMVSCSLEKGKHATAKLKPKVISEFCRELGTLLEAGVSLVRALHIITQEESVKPIHRALYNELLISIRQGTPLSEAMDDQGMAFPPLLINMMRSAEASGEMGAVCLRMAEHYEKEFRLHQKVKSAMTYPIILGILTIGVILILFLFVIPQFADMFADMDLPWITEFMMNLSNFIKNYWYILIMGVIIGVILLRVIFRIPVVAFWKDKMKVHMPVFGKLLKVLYTARFSRTLSSLYTAGLPIVSCLQIARSTVGNTYIDSQFDEVISKVRAGEPLSVALMGIDGFIAKLASTIMIGEETGALDNMLLSTSDALDYEADQAIGRMVTFIEPIMIVLMAIIVCVVIISVMLPLYGSYDAIESSAAS